MKASGFYISSRPKLHATAFGDPRLCGRSDRSGRRQEQRGEASPAGPPRAVLLVHWLPKDAWDEEADELLDSIADKIARECGIGVLAPRLRGVGASEGDFSVAGWCRDVASVVDQVAAALQSPNVPGELYGIGFGVGGSCLLSVAAGDSRLVSVAAVGAPPEFANLSLAHEDYFRKARMVGLIRSESFPPDPYAWRRELIAFAPLHHARRLAGRPTLLVCRDNDKVASPADARRLQELIGESCIVEVLPRSAPAALYKSDRVVARVARWVEEMQEQASRADAAV